MGNKHTGTRFSRGAFIQPNATQRVWTIGGGEHTWNGEGWVASRHRPVHPTRPPRPHLCAKPKVAHRRPRYGRYSGMGNVKV